MIKDAKTHNILEINLYCEKCQKITKHVRVGHVMMCGCGTTIEIVRKRTEGEQARRV